MKLKMMVPILLVAAAATTSASANWFSNPALGINRCVCTAPSPTPEQVRANRLPPFVLHQRDGAATTVAQAANETRQVATNEPARTETVQTAAPSR